MEPATVRVALPAHLRRLAAIAGPTVDVAVAHPGPEPVTLSDVLDALERAYPALRGTMREYPAAGAPGPGPLRPFIRFFALEEDLTPAGQASALPPEVSSGKEVLRIIGAIAGG